MPNMATLAAIMNDKYTLKVAKLAIFPLFRGSRLRSPAAQKDRQLVKKVQTPHGYTYIKYQTLAPINKKFSYGKTFLGQKTVGGP